MRDRGAAKAKTAIRVMTSAAAIVADVRRSIELLTDCDEPAATRTAAALSRWLAGEDDFHQALGLPSDWRMRVRVAARDEALHSLMNLHPDLDNESLAERIVAGVARANPGSPRLDGSEIGYFQDLTSLDLPGVSRLRRVLADLRGCHGAGLSHNQSSPSARNRST